MTPTVKVDASVSDEFEPDIIEVSVYIEEEAATRQRAVNLYTSGLNAVLAAAESIGVPRDEVRTGNFSIWRYGATDDHPETYECHGDVSFQLPCDEEGHRRVWGAFLDMGPGISVDIDFSLKDREAARETIVGRAVEAGRRRAAALAAATGCELGGILHVENEVSRNLGGMDYLARASGDDRRVPVFNPTPIEVSCEVTLEYELIPRG